MSYAALALFFMLFRFMEFIVILLGDKRGSANPLFVTIFLCKLFTVASSIRCKLHDDDQALIGGYVPFTDISVDFKQAFNAIELLDI